ncbi:MAG: hypothetical protein J6I40_04490 [Mailhella sp.]|nr:hypothetical protein [Mailhella sp.]
MAAGSMAKGLLGLIAAGGASGALPPDEAEAATYPGFVRQFPKLVSKEGRKELIKNGLLDENGRMYVGTLEPDVYETLSKRDKSITDNNVWISRHAADQRLRYDDMQPEELAKRIAGLVDSSDTKVMGNFPTRFPMSDQAKWMLASKDGGSYTAAPVRAGDFGDVELKTVFEPQYDKKTYLDRMDWGGPRLPYMFTQERLPEQRISQPQGLSVVSHPSSNQKIADFLLKSKEKIPMVTGAATGAGAAMWPMQTADGRIVWPADVPGWQNAEPGLQEAWNPAELPAAAMGVPGMLGKFAAMAADPAASYVTDKAFGGLLGMIQRQRPQAGGGGI